MRFIFNIILVIGLLTAITTANAADQNHSGEILDRIAKAKNELASAEQSLLQESNKLTQILDKKEMLVKDLREQVASKQRLEDEQLMSMEKLKERLDLWEAQSKYQHRLLEQYLDVLGLKPTAPSDPLITSSSAQTLEFLQHRIDNLFTYHWTTEKVETPYGEILPFKVLSLGPVKFALNEEQHLAGLISKNSLKTPKIEYMLNGSDSAQLMQLAATGKGDITFDPTLGNAIQLSQQGDGVVTTLQKGGVWVIPIVFFGFLSLIIASLKAYQFIRLPKFNTELIINLTKQSLIPQTGNASPVTAQKIGFAQQKLVKIATDYPVSQQRDDLFVAFLSEYRHRLDKYMGVVATSASVAPLLGLLGTVSGMIDTFKMMTLFGSGDVSTVSGGISVALITTELGLIVAIPSLVIGALLNRQSKNYLQKLEQFAIKLSKLNLRS